MLKSNQIARDRVHKAQFPGMQSEFREQFKEPLIEASPGAGHDSQSFVPATVFGIPEYRVTLRFQMDADLMSAACFQAKCKQGSIAVGFKDTIGGHGFFAAATLDCEPLTIAGVAAQRGIDDAFILFEAAPDQCDVLALHGARRKLLGQFAMNGLVLGDNQETGRAFVKPVDNARTNGLRKRRTMSDER